MSELCIYPGCQDLNDDEGGTDLCGHHLSDLQRDFAKRKREHPDYRTGMGAAKLGRLRRIEILKLLGVDEKLIMETVARLNPPYDFQEVNLGPFDGDEERRALKSRQFKGPHGLGGGKKEAYCSVFFITANGENNQELTMFRTRSMHPMRMLSDNMSAVIIPRLKEILFAREEYPYDEWTKHISCDGYDFHFA